MSLAARPDGRTELLLHGRTEVSSLVLFDSDNNLAVCSAAAVAAGGGAGWSTLQIFARLSSSGELGNS